MGINKGPHFADHDVYVDYAFEEVKFRWDHDARKIFRKFYGEAESAESVPYENRLFNDALRFGDEITRDVYEKR